LRQAGLQPHRAKHDGLGYVRSLALLAESLLFSVPVGTEMVHFPRCLPLAYGFSQGYPGLARVGFPFGDDGQSPVCGHVAYRSLPRPHRLLAQGIHRTPLVA